MPALDLVKDLIAFDTTSRDSNLGLIDYAQALLEKSGARCRRSFDASGRKANLFATIGPDGDGGFVLSGHTDVVPVDGQDWSSAPFKPEVRDGKLFDHDWLGVPAGAKISVIWVHVPEEVAHARIVARGDPIDAYKLAHWDQYRERRFVPEEPVSRKLLMFDNDAPAADAYDGLLRRIIEA